MERLKEKKQKDKEEHNISAHKSCYYERKMISWVWTAHFTTESSLKPGFQAWRKGGVDVHACWTFCSAVSCSRDLNHFLHLVINTYCILTKIQHIMLLTAFRRSTLREVVFFSLYPEPSIYMSCATETAEKHHGVKKASWCVFPKLLSNRV